MKKKILSLILVFMLLPIASVFVACGKDKGYNLNNLNADFKNVVEENDNLKINGKQVVFDYSSHDVLNNAVASTYPYTELTKYNTVFYNLMYFTYEYIDVCSNNDALDNKDVKNQVESKLIDLKKSISDVDDSVNMLAEILNTNSTNVLQDVCLTRYENLLETYDSMFESASNFNYVLSDLYFNKILRDGNPDIASVSLDDFDANIVINRLDARIKFQIANISQSYFEINIDGGKLAESIANRHSYLDLSAYENEISLINKIFEEEVAAEKANHSKNKEKFYNLAVQAQNIQSVLNNDLNKFITACNDIHFLNVTESLVASAHEKMCVEIIKSNKELIAEYNDVLAQMINIITGV